MSGQGGPNGQGIPDFLSVTTINDDKMDLTANVNRFDVAVGRMGINGNGTNVALKMQININACISNKQLTTPSQSPSHARSQFSEYYDTHVYVGDNEMSGDAINTSKHSNKSARHSTTSKLVLRANGTNLGSKHAHPSRNDKSSYVADNTSSIDNNNNNNNDGTSRQSRQAVGQQKVTRHAIVTAEYFLSNNSDGIGTIFAFVTFVILSNKSQGWCDVTQSVMFYQVLKYLLRLDERKFNVNNKPCRLNVFLFANNNELGLINGYAGVKQIDGLTTAILLNGLLNGYLNCLNIERERRIVFGSGVPSVTSQNIVLKIFEKGKKGLNLMKNVTISARAPALQRNWV